MTQCNETGPLYVFDLTLDEFRPATDGEIDAATNLATYAQDAVRYHAALRRIRDMPIGGQAILNLRAVRDIARDTLSAALPGNDA